MNAPLDIEIPLQKSLCASVQRRPGCDVGYEGVRPSGDEAEKAEAERFGQSLYRIRTAVNHAIAAHYQAMAGEVNAEKLKMLVEKMEDGSIRVGNYLITPSKYE